MASERLNRDQFYAKLSTLDEAALNKALWTVYWRGGAPVRERIEGVIDPETSQAAARAAAAAVPDPELVLREVTEFVALARSGAYLAGDRRVSRQERSKWRLTFRHLAAQARMAMQSKGSGGSGAGAGAAGGSDAGASAVAALVDLAGEMRGYDYFRSEDPVAAARFVVSDEVAALWSQLRTLHGPAGFTSVAAAQLLRWESPYGWTRFGDGWVAERERPLADVFAELLVGPDAWVRATLHYLDALDRAASGGDRRRSSRGTTQRADDLALWHAMLLERLARSEHEGLLDRLVNHAALGGPELTFLKARLAYTRGDLDSAAALARTALASLPGHRGFREFADDVAAQRHP